MPNTSDISDVWYAEGLQFECTRCGNCCSGEPGYVWMDDAEVERLAARVELSREQFEQVYARRIGQQTTLREKSNGDCIFYVKGEGCTVYEDRPTQCRTWPFWRRNLESPRSWHLETRTCPGVGSGQLFTLEEIEERARQVDL